MKKIVRHSYPIEISFLILSFVFLVSSFLAYDIFYIPFNHAVRRSLPYGGIFLIAGAVVIAMLVIWEELLFTVAVKHNAEILNVRNHRTKLIIQAAIYPIIPLLFFLVYKYYNIRMTHFYIWLAVCTVVPVAVKIFSGFKNFNDFLKLSATEIDYKNNEKEGKFNVANLTYISLVKDNDHILTKMILGMDDTKLTIDLDEMELEDYYDNIEEFVKRTYRNIYR